MSFGSRLEGNSRVSHALIWGEVQRLEGESWGRQGHWLSNWSRMNQRIRGNEVKKGEDAGIVRTWLLLCS